MLRDEEEVPEDACRWGEVEGGDMDEEKVSKGPSGAIKSAES